MKLRRKKLLLTFVSLIGLLFLSLIVEHFRGPWLLNRWKARMIATGEILDIDELAPPSLPRDDNGLPELTWVASRLSAFPLQLHPPAARYAAAGKVIVVSKLNEWPDSDSKGTNITWIKVAENLAGLEPLLQEALDMLEGGRFSANLHYRTGFSLVVPHVARLRSLAQVFSATALHDLHQGQTEAAFAKLKGMLAIVEADKCEPLIISQLVRNGITHLAFAATWQALQHEGWTDLQLAQLQKAWSGLTFPREMERAMQMERAIGSIEYQRFRTSDLPLSQMFDPTAFVGGGGGGATWLSWKWVDDLFEDFPAAIRDHVYTPFWKFAWSHHDELHYCRILQRMIDAHREVLSAKAGARLPARMEEIEKTAMSPIDRVRFPVALMLCPALSRAFQRAWIAQATAELTTTAIAIKRFEIRHARPPARLEELVPDFLPQCPIDYMDGQRLKYCVDEDFFLLYSVGIDGADDGGEARHATSANSNFQNGRDLVWPRSASEAEILSKWSTMLGSLPPRRRR